MARERINRESSDESDQFTSMCCFFIQQFFVFIFGCSSETVVFLLSWPIVQLKLRWSPEGTKLFKFRCHLSLPFSFVDDKTRLSFTAHTLTAPPKSLHQTWKKTPPRFINRTGGLKIRGDQTSWGSIGSKCIAEIINTIDEKVGCPCVDACVCRHK